MPLLKVEKMRQIPINQSFPFDLDCVEKPQKVCNIFNVLFNKTRLLGKLANVKTRNGHPTSSCLSTSLTKKNKGPV